MSKQPQLDPKYDPRRIEQDIYQDWEAKGYFAPRGNGKPYSIVIPPPNVTGTLHLGHGFQHTIMDLLIRFHRMDGRETLWQTGTDHAGIATQMVVTEQLRAAGTSPTELGRDEFTNRVWEWRDQAGGTITEQMRRIGSSVDWARERFTMDEGFSRAVLEVFVRLYEDGLIYRGKRLVNWDPSMETALSDLEVISEDEKGSLWHLRYPLANGAHTKDGKDYLVVATTRPETMLGDTGVAVHPDDERYQDLIGKTVTLPLVGRELPIIADDYVDPEFGTGCLKITPAHDFNDNEIGARHDLELINIFTSTATLNENVPEQFGGMDRFTAREEVISQLDSLGLLELQEDYTVQIPRGERSGEVLEPWLTDQWFVAIKELAEPAIEAVESGQIRFEPKRWENVYFSWMREIKDWAISRQLWWGHQIPAWYDDEGNVYVARNEQDARAKHQIDDATSLTRDPDVLDTWFSSALWTFATMGWPDETPDLSRFHPTDVLVTGHDIIFFWVARMIMMTLRFTGDVPFKQVFVHGLVRDRHGQKMTKTKGNGLDPIDVIDGVTCDDLVSKRTANLTQASLAEKIAGDTSRDFPDGIPAYGTDALRFTFSAIASPGQSSYPFDLQQVEGYHFFCNKLWNATKFVLSNVDADFRATQNHGGLADRWIKSQLRRVIQASRQALTSYRFDRYAQQLYQFAWHEYCDWYLELTKPVLFNEDKESESYVAAQSTLVVVLESLVRLLHPLVPYITETIWQQIAPLCDNHSESVMLAEYPAEDDFQLDEQAERAIAWLQEVVTAIRNLRSARQIPPGNQVTVQITGHNDSDREFADVTQVPLARLAKVRELELIDGGIAPIGSTQVVGNLSITLPFEDDAERQAESKRLQKEVDRLDSELTRSLDKLNNENFVSRAPADVVEKERERQSTYESQLRVLREQLNTIGAD
ncbi:MAG: valine--tRNA ligase [Gammaproteobacteria bacterium]|nr:valine--tRNA ligase [Gammaproteobacteria bacterium]